MGLRETVLNYFKDPASKPKEQVDFPELGITIFVRTLTSRQLFDLRAWWREGCGDEEPDEGDVHIKTVLMTCVDASGQLVFKPEEDFEAWAEAPPIFLARIWRVAGLLNGLIDAGDEEKNSASEGTSTPSSSSVATSAADPASSSTSSTQENTTPSQGGTSPNPEASAEPTTTQPK